MPELPEVQTTVNGINEHVKGLKIHDVWTDYKSAHHAGKDNIKDPSFFAHFKKRVVGAAIVSATRRAKNVLIHLDKGHTVIVHMKMTGHLLYGAYEKKWNGDKQRDEWKPVGTGPLSDPFNRHIRLVFMLSNGRHLVLSDTRRFAKVTIEKTENLEKSSHLQSGPEPLEDTFTLVEFTSRLNKRPNAPIKQVLMDHSIIAGIGNIYSDEILWKAGIHPLEKVKNVALAKLKLAFIAMKEVLVRGIRLGGDSMSDYRNILGELGKFQENHQAYRRTGKKCTKRGCKGAIIKMKIGGRSAHFCDTHQKLTPAS